MGVVSRFQIPPDLSVAQMVEHTPTFFLYGIIAQWGFISFGRAGVTKDSVPVVRTHLIPQIDYSVIR